MSPNHFGQVPIVLDESNSFWSGPNHFGQVQIIEISPQKSNALSFYGFKIILDRPNHFGRVPIIWGGSNLFWLGPNHFGQVQIIKISPEKSNLTLTKMLWARPKLFGPDQNDWYSTKMIWSVQIHFEATEAQGIKLQEFFIKSKFTLI